MAQVPAAALPYQRSLTREARAVWGLNAPVPVMAAQIQQESAWSPNVCSTFACGLAQFTPATATWISGAYPKSLADANPMNPEWALRALVQYDYRLHASVAWANTDCDRWAFALSGYNGGPGWVGRDRALCLPGSCDAGRWWGSVELHSNRGMSAFKENRGYPRRILLQYQPLYTSWGQVVSCSVS